MIVSLNEVESLAYKAARGAGLSWGLAEEAAVAARWLARHGADWGPALADALENSSGLRAPVADATLPIITADRGEIHCPIRTGAWLSDVIAMPISKDMHVTIEKVRSPVLLAAFVARLSPSVDISAGGGSITWRAGRLLVTDGFPRAVADVTIDLAAGAAAQTEPTSGASGSTVQLAELAAGIAARLAVLEARTYVPASAQSRLSGAGAGLADND